MFFRSALAVATALSLKVLAVPLREGVVVDRRVVPASHVLHERGLPHWEQTWEQKQRLPADMVLPMRFGLRQSNLRDGHDILMDMWVL